VEIWTEVILETQTSPDELVLASVLPLVETLADHIDCWHYFWEPDLCVRLRWRTAMDQKAGDEILRGALDRGGQPWRFGRYAGDAPMYGEEMWPVVQKDLSATARLAASVVTHEIPVRYCRRPTAPPRSLLRLLLLSIGRFGESPRYQAWRITYASAAALREPDTRRKTVRPSPKIGM